MSLRRRRFLRLVLVGVILACLAGPTAEARPSARARPSGHVSRSGPARGGSFQHQRTRSQARRAERPARPDAVRPQPRRTPDASEQAPRARPEQRSRRTATPERREATRVESVDVDKDGNRNLDEPHERRKARERRQQHVRRERRRDYYDDRRDFVRGARFSASWWRTSCAHASILATDGYTYYECDGVWYSRTYYGGDVVYTVVDPPRGY